MNTKQIIDEMVRTLAARTWSADHKGTFVDFLDGVESVVNPAVRKLIESLAEEVIGEDEDYRGHSAVNDFKAKQRLKVKEIITNLK